MHLHNITCNFISWHITLLSRAFAREHYYKLFRKSFAASILAFAEPSDINSLTTQYMSGFRRCSCEFSIASHVILLLARRHRFFVNHRRCSGHLCSLWLTSSSFISWCRVDLELVLPEWHTTCAVGLKNQGKWCRKVRLIYFRIKHIICQCMNLQVSWFIWTCDNRHRNHQHQHHQHHHHHHHHQHHHYHDKFSL